MKYFIDVRFLCYREFATYEEAELFCGEHGIHAEEIFEIVED